MSQNLYLANAEPKSGKSVVLLGLMEHLTRLAGRVGLFRPVIPSGEAPDPAIRLVQERYGLDFPDEAMFGLREDAAHRMVAAGRYDELMKQLLDRYKQLEAQCDFVICLGSDFTGVASSLELEFNIDVANNLGAPLLPIVNGYRRSSPEILDALNLLLETLQERGSEVIAAVINRVLPSLIEELDATLRGVEAGMPIYSVADQPILSLPTVAEVAHKLGATCLCGEQLSLDRQVAHFRVAAMELPHFLDYFQEGSLVITPGDRSDIILGTLMADTSESYPHAAGLLLTGGMHPPEPIQRLLNGLGDSAVPVLSTERDTFDTALAVSRVESYLTARDERKIAAALGVMDSAIDYEALLERITLNRSERMTPLMFEYELIRRAKQRRMHIVLPEGSDERILRAAELLCLRGVVDLTLLGPEEAIRTSIRALGLSALDQIPVIDPATSPLRQRLADRYFELRRHKGISEQIAYDALADVSYFGTMMVAEGEADGMVSGAVHTTQHTIRPAFEVIRTRPDAALVSSVFFMCLEDRVLVYGDCAVNPNPNAEQLASIAVNAADTAAMFGIIPRIAMLSYSTGESGRGEDVDKVREATRLARESRPDLKIEGPIQYDAAVDVSVARSKLPGSEVAGHATLFIFPDLNTGNNTYKAVQRSAGAVAVGPVLQGLNKPVNDLSRGCTVTDIVNTVAITAIQAQAIDRG